ncbi:O-methyltransferase [Mycena olivaceomarginata]|nr:O-methyltransferase [Mycena olivaceomarginata]
MHPISMLRQLSNIISDAVDDIERTYEASGKALPSIDQPFDQNDPAEALLKDARVSSATKNIMAAAAQLSATVCDPRRGAVNMSKSFLLSSCLRAASELDVVELLREAGTKGANAADIAAVCKVDAGIMGERNPSCPWIDFGLSVMQPEFCAFWRRTMFSKKLLPGVFANNRLPSVFDKGKSTSALRSNPADRLTGSSGVAAMAEHSADLGAKSAAYLLEAMTTTPGADSKLAFNIAFGTTESLYTWMQEPQNRLPADRFSVAMTGAEPAENILQGFDWSKLPSGGRVVDVGGGIGHVSLMIAKRYPHLRAVNQDLGQAIEISKAHWKETFPEHLEKGLAEFQVHDFFAPQLVKDAAVFLLRGILHNWQDAQAVVILRSLRSAALPSTRLVIGERILPLASRVGSKSDNIRGTSRPTAKAPLLPNWGPGMADSYLYDLSMQILLGGVERTLDGFQEILAEAGWQLVEVHHSQVGLPMSQLVAAPI